MRETGDNKVGLEGHPGDEVEGDVFLRARPGGVRKKAGSAFIWKSRLSQAITGWRSVGFVWTAGDFWGRSGSYEKVGRDSNAGPRLRKGSLRDPS